MECLIEAGTIARQAASDWELAYAVNGRNGIARRQLDDARRLAEKEFVATDRKSTGMLFDERREDGLEVAFGAGLHDEERQPEPLRRCLRAVCLGGYVRSPRVYQETHSGRIGPEFVQ